MTCDCIPGVFRDESGITAHIGSCIHMFFFLASIFEYIFDLGHVDMVMVVLTVHKRILKWISFLPLLSCLYIYTSSVLYYTYS